MKTGTDIQYAAELLQSGEAVAIPTETVYGLAANAFDADAVLKIFEIKNRPRFNPLIVHTDAIEKINNFCLEFPSALKHICEKFWPGPLTVLLPKSNIIHDIVTAGSHFVAVRIPAHPLTLKLLSRLNFPLAAPSANIFGYISPTTPQHVEMQLGNKIKYILNGGNCRVGIESTIIKLNDNNKIEILRPGGISSEEISKVTGYEISVTTSKSIDAPGMLQSHYAPNKKLIAGNMDELIEKNNEKKIAVLSFKKKYAHSNIVLHYCLSPSGNLHEAAKNLFSALHALDASSAEIILAEIFPETGIGRAINDRIKKASFS